MLTQCTVPDFVDRDTTYEKCKHFQYHSVVYIYQVVTWWSQEIVGHVHICAYALVYLIHVKTEKTIAGWVNNFNGTFICLTEKCCASFCLKYIICWCMV